jgi:ASPIC and UnbV/Secretion system C-terminal sorting domain
LKNNNNFLFTDATDYSGLEVNSNCWAGLWIDYDLDGDDDIQICDADMTYSSDPNSFFVNDGTGHFVELNNGAMVSGDDGFSFCSAKGDMNNDGRWDYIVLSDFPESVDLFENATAENNWIKLGLQGTASNADGIGSLIKVYSQGKFYMTQTRAGENLMSQDSQYEIVGLGSNTSIDSLVVYWPSGWIDRWFDLTANQFLLLYEGATYAVNIASSSNYVDCSDSPVALSVDNSNAQYLWSNNSQEPSIQITEQGWYWVQVTNEWGISTIDSVFIETYDAPNVLSQVFNVTCHGFNDGAIYLALEESEIANVFWNSPFVEGSAPTGIPQGIYQYELVDQNGCAIFGEIEITEPSLFSIEPYSINACYEESVSYTPVITGGTGTLYYDWQNINPMELFAGQYSFSVVDELGCDTVFEIEVGQWSEIITQLEVINASDGSTGSCQLNPSGGSGDFEFIWSNGNDSGFADSLSQGNYDVVITDSNGCNSQVSFSIIDLGGIDSFTRSGISPSLIDDRVVVNNYIGDIKVFNLAGECVKSFKASSNEFIISTAEWSSGIYLIRCGSENHRVVKK